MSNIEHFNILPNPYQLLNEKNINEKLKITIINDYFYGLICTLKQENLINDDDIDNIKKNFYLYMDD
jgi:hypothetical protein